MFLFPVKRESKGKKERTFQQVGVKYFLTKIKSSKKDISKDIYNLPKKKIKFRINSNQRGRQAGGEQNDLRDQVYGDEWKLNFVTNEN